jgi:hypothetical protein
MVEKDLDHARNAVIQQNVIVIKEFDELTFSLNHTLGVVHQPTEAWPVANYPDRMTAVPEMALKNALDTLVRAVVADQDFQSLITLG